MEKAVDYMNHEFAAVRTGKASPALVENIDVEAYDSMMKLKQLALITTPEPRLLVIQPWDKSLIGPIEKAIQKSELGLNPNNDGTVIRLALPQLNEQRRQELAKQVRKRSEEAKVAARNLRRDADNELKKLEKAGTLSQDDLRRSTERVQKLTDQTIKQVEEAADRKEREVKEV